MALHCATARAKTVCSLEQLVFVLLNDKSRMKGDFHVESVKNSVSMENIFS